MKPLDKPLLLEIYRKMVSVRTFEETAADLFLKGQIPGFLHVYIGEEAVAAGVMAHLTDQDFISSTHRGHGHAVAKGARLIAERIKDIARSASVPIIENRIVAQTLFKTVDVGEEIPPKLYQAVAEILAYVYQLNKTKKERAAI